jgi:hypothetical protein
MAKWFGLIIMGSALSLAAWASAHAGQNPLRPEAERLFAYDRAHPHVLPGHRLRALSIAIEFGNDEGARKLLRELQGSIQKN